MSSECDPLAEAETTASMDAILTAINTVLWDNFTVLGLTGVMLGLSTLVIWFCVSRMTSLIADWMSLREATESQRSQPTYNQHPDDDVTYASAIDNDEGSAKPESTSVFKRIADITAMYAPYNSAMVKYAQRRGMVADDLIDHRIVSRANDNYAYRRRRRDDLRFRRSDDGGEWVVVSRKATSM